MVLIQLAAGPLPEETRILGAWCLRAMLRLLWLAEPCTLVVDEFARLGYQGRAAVELLSLGREFGKRVILCSQGPSDLDELSRHALAEAAQDAGWALLFRQGTRDSAEASRLLGVRQGRERAVSADNRGRVSVFERPAEQPWVLPSELEALVPGEGFLRVAPIERDRVRVERVRVAVPSLGPQPGPRSADIEGGALRTHGPPTAPPREAPAAVGPALATLTIDADLAKVRAQLERRPNGCLVWTGPVVKSTGRPRVWLSDGRWHRVYVWLWERERGALPSGWTLHHFRCATSSAASSTI